MRVCAVRWFAATSPKAPHEQFGRIPPLPRNRYLAAVQSENQVQNNINNIGCCIMEAHSEQRSRHASPAHRTRLFSAGDDVATIQAAFADAHGEGERCGRVGRGGAGSCAVTTWGASWAVGGSATIGVRLGLAGKIHAEQRRHSPNCRKNVLGSWYIPYRSPEGQMMLLVQRFGRNEETSMLLSHC